MSKTLEEIKQELFVAMDFDKIFSDIDGYSDVAKYSAKDCYNQAFDNVIKDNHLMDIEVYLKIGENVRPVLSELFLQFLDMATELKFKEETVQ